MEVKAAIQGLGFPKFVFLSGDPCNQDYNFLVPILGSP